MALRIPYDSQLARKLNIAIFETIYHAALEESSDRAKQLCPYRAWVGSPASQGKLQMDMWPTIPAQRYDFGPVRLAISEHGLRNSNMTAQMPTASTAYILGNSAGTEPYARCALSSEVLRTSHNSYHTQQRCHPSSPQRRLHAALLVAGDRLGRTRTVGRKHESFYSQQPR